MSKVQKLIDYLQKHKAKYSMDKLKAHLIKFGYKLEDVDAAIAKVSVPAPPPQAPSLPPGSTNPPNITMVPGTMTQSPTSPQVTQPPASPQVTQPPASPQVSQPPVSPAAPAQPQAAEPAAEAKATDGEEQAVEPAAEAEAADGEEKEPPKKKIGRGFILVVDDDDNIRSMLTEYLTDLGHRVTSASDGWQGVVQAEGLQIKMILTDIEMPGFGSGVDAFKKLRASPFVRKDLPVIFITGMVPEDAKKIVPLEDPNVRLLFKPLDFELMEKHLDEML